MPVSKISRSLLNRRQREHHCEKHRTKFVCRSGGAGVEGEVEHKHDAIWRSPEGGRREDAQAKQASVSWRLARREAWQANGDDGYRRHRLDQERQNV